MVHRSLGIDLGFVGSGARCIGQLRATQNVEVVVGGMAAGVTLSSYGRAENDEVFRDAWGLGISRGFQGVNLKGDT